MQKLLSVCFLVFCSCSPATENAVRSFVTSPEVVDTCAEALGTRPRVVRLALAVGLAVHDVAKQLCALPAVAEQASHDPDAIDSAFADSCLIPTATGGAAAVGGASGRFE